MKQEEAFKILKAGHNVFLTGQAGSGKTYLLNKFIKYLKKRGSKVAITASTGIASTHIGGITIHSWSGIGVKMTLSEKDIRNNLKKFYIQKRLDKTEVLIIDEISMLHPEQLDMVDMTLRHFKGTWKLFGGLQVVLCGDFFQLPPVRKADDDRRFVFDSQSWVALDLRICYLTEQHRSKDDKLSYVLNSIRAGDVGRELIEVLNDVVKENNDLTDATKIYTHNIDVEKINQQYLANLNEQEFTFDMKVEGNERVAEFLVKGCLAPVKLKLKRNALVMFVKNNFKEGYVNGTLGKIVDFDGEGYPIVRTFNNNTFWVRDAEWAIEEDNETVVKLTQLPLRLAWAITVHKSQGMTLDRAEIDLSRAFEVGMGYAALSRVRTLRDLNLRGFNRTALMVDPQLAEFDKNLRELSVIGKL